MTTEQMCIDASKSLVASINRSAGQHTRAMKALWNAGAPSEEEIYCMCMESDVAYKFGAWLCKQAGVTYPPENRS